MALTVFHWLRLKTSPVETASQGMETAVDQEEFQCRTFANIMSSIQAHVE